MFLFMSDRDYIVMLYDFYGELFNDKQKTYFEAYYFQNLSLGEISANLGVSRNAVYKVLQGIDTKLKFYEEKLELYKKNQMICAIIKLEKDIEIKKKLEELI